MGDKAVAPTAFARSDAVRRLRLVGVCVLLATIVSLELAGPAGAANVPHAVVVSANPVNWTPHVLDGRVYAIVQIGNRVYAGGRFTQVRNWNSTTVLARRNLFAFNATTGIVDMQFLPQPDREVRALARAPDGDLLAAGVFNNVKGVAKRKVAKLNPVTGDPRAAFKANATATVRDLAVVGSTLYLGGSFTKVNNVVRERLAAVDAATGAVRSDFNLPVTVPRKDGTTPNVYKLDVSPNGSTMVVIGNFKFVGGLPRHQVGMIDLTTTPASVANWQTDGFVPFCHPTAFDTYMRDVDFSPDGSYFVIVTTGAYSAGTLCDVTSRWETAHRGTAIQPTWAEYTGGDTLYSVGVTGTAVYVGGHQRWMNNPFCGDCAGPGSVPRSGIAALNPVNGSPFSWNPGRKRGVGAFALYSTTEGLWMGSDTDRTGGEFHARIAMFPVAGGTTVPPNVPSGLPGDLYNVPLSSCAGGDPSILYRVNAAGPELPALDCGPAWASDTASTSPYRNSGSNAATWDTGVTRHSSLPATAPSELFLSERWDPGDNPPMQWSFPVAGGTPIEVRLFFANQYDGTADPGQRVFDVSIDGAPVLDDYDIVADVGHGVGRMQAFDLTSDGTVNIDFDDVVENPLVNGIEIVRTDLPPAPGPGATTSLGRRSFDGATVGPHGTLATPGIDWSTARGVFLLNGNAYYGRNDAKLFVRSFNGSSFGPAQEIDLRGLTNFPLASVTGMFFDPETEHILYTVSGDARMYSRAFTPESRIVGAQVFQASGPGVDGFSWSDTRGITLADGMIYFARVDGSLYEVGFTDGRPSGAATVVSPASGGYHWASRGLFVRG